MRRPAPVVVHVIGAFAAGGAERFVADLVSELASERLSMVVIALSSDRDEPGVQMISHMSQRGVRCLSGPTATVGIRSLLWYTSQIRTLTPVLVHLHTENTELAHFLAGPMVSAQIPVVRTLHTVAPAGDLLRRTAAKYGRAAASIACGPAVYRHYQRHPPAGLTLIENGTRFHWPVVDDEEKKKLQRSLGLGPEQMHFLCVGNLKGVSLEQAPKAHDVLLSAWSRAGLGRCGARLHILGDGNLSAALQALAGEDESIQFHGVRSDVSTWLGAADCFVMPSRYEGLPIAAIEALGSGLPCILSDIDSLKPFGCAAFRQVPVDDVEALAAAMEEAGVARPGIRRDLATQVRREYGIARCAERYRGLYERFGIMP